VDAYVRQLIDRGDLEAGSGFSLRASDYQEIVKGSAKSLLKRSPKKVPR